MRLRAVSCTSMLLVALAVSIPSMGSVAGAQTANAEVQQWRKAYADTLDRPDGWLALVALQWLQDGDTTVGSAPDNKLQLKHVPAHLGILRQHQDRVEFLPSADTAAGSVLIDGRPATSGLLNSDRTDHPSTIAADDVQMTVIQRGDRIFLRVKDAYAPTRLHFRGLNWYAPDPRYRITAKWVPYTPEKTLSILNVLGQPSNEPAPGYAEFQIDGKTVRLDATLEGDTLFFDLRDTTSRSTTDGTGRFLNTGLPSNGIHAPGTLVIDFNYAHNPPCGYTPYATCPLPPAQNRIDVSIPAGEKRYGDN